MSSFGLEWGKKKKYTQADIYLRREQSLKDMCLFEGSFFDDMLLLHKQEWNIIQITWFEGD